MIRVSLVIGDNGTLVQIDALPVRSALPPIGPDDSLLRDLIDVRRRALHGDSGTVDDRVAAAIYVRDHVDAEAIELCTHTDTRAVLLRSSSGDLLDLALIAVNPGLVLDPRIARRLADRARRTGDDHRFDLTPREVEVVRLLAEDLAVKQIARSLGVTPKTVENRLTSIYAKLGVTNRREAVTRAAGAGALDDA